MAVAFRAAPSAAAAAGRVLALDAGAAVGTIQLASIYLAVDEEHILFIEVDPYTWLKNGEDSFLDPRLFDFDQTGEVHGLEVKIEDGFTKIEIGG